MSQLLRPKYLYESLIEYTDRAHNTHPAQAREFGRHITIIRERIDALLLTAFTALRTTYTERFCVLSSLISYTEHGDPSGLAVEEVAKVDRFLEDQKDATTYAPAGFVFMHHAVGDEAGYGRCEILGVCGPLNELFVVYRREGA